MLNKILKFILTKKFLTIGVFAILFLFILLSFRKPFDNRSILSNLDPFPDSLFYSYPAWNLAHGRPFKMVYEGAEIIQIKPGYTILLTIPFSIWNDVRSFYFLNMSLSIVLIILIYIFLNKIFEKEKYKNLIILPTLFMFSTNFYVYTNPILLMAENPSMIFVFILYLMLALPLNKKLIYLAPLMGIYVYFIKISNIPTTAIFLLTYTLKVFLSKETRKLKIAYLATFSLTVLAFIVYELQTSFKEYAQVATNGTAFNIDYVFDQFVFYMRAMLSYPTQYLWFSNRLVDPIVPVLIVIGTLAGLIDKRYRRITFAGLLIIFPLIGFLVIYNYSDARLISSLLPIFYIFLAIAIAYLLKKTIITKGILLIVAILSLYLLAPDNVTGNARIVDMKTRIVTNLRYKEDPWNYLAIENINQYFKNNNKPESTYLATFLPPYYIDYFTNHKYKILPISKFQEFAYDPKNLLGKLYPMNDLLGYYEKLIKEGNDVYISDYYLMANFKYFGPDLERVYARFDAELVKDGCLDTCRLYKLHIKDD